MGSEMFSNKSKTAPQKAMLYFVIRISSREPAWQLDLWRIPCKTSLTAITRIETANILGSDVSVT